MSDDEFGLDEDEFFSHPDLLANVEKVEQEHRQLTQGVRKPAPAGSKSDTSGKVGQGERKVSGGYHHAVARPAAGFGRGRGRNPLLNSSSRPSTSHLAPQPKVYPVPSKLAQTVVQAKPVLEQDGKMDFGFTEDDDDDDDDMFGGVIINENGGYTLIEPTIKEKPGDRVSNGKESLQGDRKGLGRSTSLTTFDSQPRPPNSTRTMLNGPAPERLNGSQGSSSWGRTMSAEALARREAIQKAIPSSNHGPVHGTSATNQGQTVNVLPPRAQPVQAGQAVSLEEYEKMKRELATLRAELEKKEKEREEAKREAQTKAGEAQNMRKVAEMRHKENESLTAEMKQKYLTAQEQLKKTAAEHRKELETVQTKYTFDMHNQKAFKFHSGSQAVVGNADPGPSYTRDTPSRSQSQLRLPFETPSRSTGRNQRSPRANRTESRLGDMGPPPPPRFDTSAFKTPMSQSRHGKVFSTKPVPSPGFKGFQNAFSAGPSVFTDDRPDKRVKRSHAVPAMEDENELEDDAGRFDSSPREGRDDHDMYRTDDKTREGADQTHETWSTGRDDATNRREIIHLFYHHVYASIRGEWDGSRVNTVQRILNVQTSSHLDDAMRHQYHEISNSLWNCLSDTDREPSKTCIDLLVCIVQYITLLVRTPLHLTLVSALRLVSSMSIALSRFTGAQSAISNSLPSDLLLSIAHLCRPTPIPAEDHSQNPIDEPTRKTELRKSGKEGRKVSPSEDKEKEVVKDVRVESVEKGEIGRALVAFIETFVVLDETPSEAILRFAAEPTGLQALIRPTQPLDLVLDGLDLVLLLSSNPDSFRHLLGLTADENARDPTRPPLIESLCVYLRSLHPQANGITSNLLEFRTLCIFSTLCTMEKDAVTLLGQSYHLIPTLVLFLVQKTDGIWGVCVDAGSVRRSLNTLIPALTLFHHLVFPPPFGNPDDAVSNPEHSSSQQNQRTGIRLMDRLASLLSSKEYGSLHHSFYTAFARITYAECKELETVEGMGEELKRMQDFAQDLLEELVDAPEEGDEIYEVYGSGEPLDEGEDGGADEDDDDEMGMGMEDRG